MITDTATPAPPTPTRPAAPPNAQVTRPSIDYATALAVTAPAVDEEVALIAAAGAQQ